MCPADSNATAYLSIDAGIKPVNRTNSLNHSIKSINPIHNVMASRQHDLRPRGNTAPSNSDNTLGGNDESSLGERGVTSEGSGPTAVQLSAEEYTDFQAFRAVQAHRRRASLTFETQGPPKRSTLGLKTKDPNPYKGDSPEELDDFMYECERQFDAKGFPTEEDREDITPAEQAIYRQETRGKVAYATGFLEDRAKTDWKSWLIQFPKGADSWTHFKTLLREFLEGDKDEAYAESSQKLTNARQRRTDTVNEFYDTVYRLHIRLRTLDKERAYTDQQFFDYFRARVLPEYRLKLDELIPGPKTMNDLLHQLQRYEKTVKINTSREGHKDKSERSSDPQDSKKDNKSGRAANQGHKKDPGDKKNKKDKSSSTRPLILWKDKLSDDVRSRRNKDQACYKCGLPGHATRDCTAKEQILHDTQAMLDAAKNK